MTPRDSGEGGPDTPHRATAPEAGAGGEPDPGPEPEPEPEAQHRLRRLAHLAGADDGLPIDPDLDPGDPGEPSRDHRPATAPVHRLHPVTLAAIGAGGFVGAWGRYELGLAWTTGPSAFPATTLVINTSGALLLGLLLTLLVEHVRAPLARDHVRHFACVGVLGSWTTMSAFAVGSDALVRAGRGWMALAYVAAMVVAGVAAVTMGIALGRVRGVPRPAPSVEMSQP